MENLTTMKKQTADHIQLSIDHRLSSKIMPDMMESGSLEKTSDKVRANKSGQTVQCTKDGGKTTKLTEKEDSSMLTETSMTDNG